MSHYYVHYQVPVEDELMVEATLRMIMPVEAKSEAAAIKICKEARSGSCGHRVYLTSGNAFELAEEAQ